MPDLSIFSVHVIAIQGGTRKIKRIKKDVFLIPIRTRGGGNKYWQSWFSISYCIYIHYRSVCVHICTRTMSFIIGTEKKPWRWARWGDRDSLKDSHIISQSLSGRPRIFIFILGKLSLSSVYFYTAAIGWKRKRAQLYFDDLLVFSELEGVGCCCSSGGVYTIDRERKIPTTLIHQELADGDVLPPAASSWNKPKKKRPFFFSFFTTVYIQHKMDATADALCPKERYTNRRLSLCQKGKITRQKRKQFFLYICSSSKSSCGFLVYKLLFDITREKNIF